MTSLSPTEARPAEPLPDGVLELLGTRVGPEGRFELEAFAAAGGMGHIYRARDALTGATVAVKLVAPRGGDAVRFAREADVLASIGHPGVVRYVHHGPTEDGRQYLAMEWLTGEDLGARLKAGPLGVSDVLALAKRTAAALAAVHARGVVHRDLKPANLFLVDGRVDAVKLLDFGVARTLTNVEAATVTGAIVGTPAYMAPEQVSGERVSASADVYALGAVMFRCLSGRPPFQGPHPLAVLAKIVIEPAAPLGELCPDAGLSPQLEALVARMLAKDPSARPADGEAAAAAIAALDAGATPREPGAVVAAAVTGREQRIASLVLSGGSRSDEHTVPTQKANALLRSIEQRGGVTAILGSGAWLVTVPGAASAVEQATRAVWSAEAIAAARPGLPVFVATGRVLVSGAVHVGEVIDRLTEAVVAAVDARSPGGVRVDAATAELLEGRFRTSGDGAWRAVVREEDALAPRRTLLGRPSPHVGREQVQGILASTIAAAFADSRASAALVTAPPGLGKTRLLHETVRAAVASTPGLDVLSGAADPIRAGSPFAVASQMLRRAAGIRDEDDAASARRKLAHTVVADGEARGAALTEMLGEICGVLATREEASPALRAARADPSIMRDELRDAWIAWLDARAARAPVLLTIEDLHWADAASVRLFDAALGALADRPFSVLATARPDVQAAFPDLFHDRGLVALHLTPLSARASERLVRDALGESASPALVQSILRRAGGHPFFLEELVRAAAAGCAESALPDSVLATVQARLDAESPRPRRLLRAASVFGETFSSGGIAALLGEDFAAPEVDATLAQLVQQEIVHVERASAAPGQTAYRFRHALVRDAAYAMLAEPDRVAAHRSAAAWLERVGEDDPAVLAEHYDRGGMRERTLSCLRRAAAHALSHHDLDRAMAHTERALSLSPGPADEAALRTIEAEVHYWRGDLAHAAERASSAAARLPRGALEWFEAVAVAIGALGQLGKNADVAAWLEEAVAPGHAEAPDARGAHVVALCRGMTQLFWAHHPGDRGAVRACLDGLVAQPEPLDTYQRGWVHRVRGESAWLHARDLGLCLAELDASCAAFQEARATRALCLTRLNAASLAGWSGATARGLALVALARADAERVGATFLVRYANAVLGLVCAFAGEPAQATMTRALAEVGGTPRLAFVCDLVLAWQALEDATLDVESADRHARHALALPLSDHLRPAALALAARVHLARGETADGLRVAREAEALAAACSDLELTHGIAGTTLAEALDAAGDRDAAKRVLADQAADLDAIARTLPSALERGQFWARRMPNDRVKRLAAAWGLDAPPQ
jgi:hypothetical protein